MSNDAEKYNGWTNRETWAVALHINNDQGWQESVRDSLRGDDRLRRILRTDTGSGMAEHVAGGIIRESVEDFLDPDEYEREFGGDQPTALRRIAGEVGSLWRVNWDELGASFLEDIDEL